MGICASRSGPRVVVPAHEKSLVNQSPQLMDFELRRVIGKGAFGKVKVVVHKCSGAPYALKYIDKDVCVERNAVANIIRERKILQMLNHPLVCNLRFAFQDADFLYIVSDLMLGGDLRFHLLRKTFSELAIRHWVAELAMAIAYCHSLGIIHRDIKPDNVLLDELGHVKLADFNISTQIKGAVLPQSRSGSLYYMAPEVHAGKIYDQAIDYWSLGILFYECIYGCRPFGGKTNNDIIGNICTKTLIFQPTLPAVTPACCSIIETLLQKNPQNRARTSAAVTQHPFFRDLDFPLVGSAKSTPIYKPGAFKNFDASWELEEILLHDSPLEAQRIPTKNRKKADPNNGNESMMHMLEKYFTDFDFREVKLEEAESDPASLTLPSEPASNRNSCDLTATVDMTLTEPDVEVGQSMVESSSLPGHTTTRTSVSQISAWNFIARRKEQAQELSPGVLANRPRARVTITNSTVSLPNSKEELAATK